MFAVPKYSEALEQLRKERDVEGLFQHNLVAVDAEKKVATFKNLGDSGKEVKREYDFLHVVPPQKPWDWVAKSPLGRSIPTPHPTCRIHRILPCRILPVSQLYAYGYIGTTLSRYASPDLDFLCRGRSYR